MFAYASPVAFRRWDDPSDLLPGEVYFDHPPSAAELAAAFPNYVAPVVAPTFDFLAFLALFTSDEETAIFTARRSDVQVDKFITMAAGANAIVLNDPRVVAGVDYLVSANLIASARATDVLAGTPPTS